MSSVTLNEDIKSSRSSLNLPHVRTRSSSRVRMPRTPSATSIRSDISGHEDDIPRLDFHLDNQLPSDYFKADILALLQGLRIPRWHRLSSGVSSQLRVTRISGALTNAVYSIEPPADLQTRKPAKLLLRVYGPQADHLVDRANELEILGRLSQQGIGPRLLGIFSNGRIEQFLPAVPLTKNELWDLETSAKIARRMKELHMNVSLTKAEREAGPLVWKKLDAWRPRVEWVLSKLAAGYSSSNRHKSVESVLGCSWQTYLKMNQKYKDWVMKRSGGDAKVLKRLVFCHNDAQYGNLLRVEHPKGSPLLDFKYEHKNIVVIDFEFSGANVPGFDIANHFLEWTSDFHADSNTQDIHEEKFPDYDAEMNFISAYVQEGRNPLENFTDLSVADEESEKAREKAIADEERELLIEATAWRPAVNIHWVYWGIVQAYQEESGENEDNEKNPTYKKVYDEGESSPEPGDEAEELYEDDFDYFDYAHQKSQLVWNDLVKFGVIDPNDPEYKEVTFKSLPCYVDFSGPEAVIKKEQAI